MVCRNEVRNGWIRERGGVNKSEEWVKLVEFKARNHDVLGVTVVIIPNLTTQ